MSWIINPETGDYVMTNGKPTESESLLYPAYYRTKIRRGAWMHAPDSRYGSDFGNISQRFNGRDLPTLANIQKQALQPMIDDKRAIAVDVTYDGTQQGIRNNSALKANITSADGTTETLLLPPLGA